MISTSGLHKANISNHIEGEVTILNVKKLFFPATVIWLVVFNACIHLNCGLKDDNLITLYMITSLK